jgi:mannose-6-phosphate isomerase-like protein (cupin superfamily)
LDTYKEQRPWGWFEQFNKNSVCTVKLIGVKAKSRLSLQYHTKRKEFWKVVKGPAVVEIDGKKFTGKAGDEFEIPTGAKHRLAAKNADVLILEISYGQFDEDDIVRIEDDFGRTKDATTTTTNDVLYA